MATTIGIEDLRIGMFIHLDLGWWAHPFALSSFMIGSAAQIATLRTLGLKRVRWSPERSHLAPEAVTLAAGPDDAPADDGPCTQPAIDAARSVAADVAVPPASAADEARASRRRTLMQQRRAAALCQRQYAEAARAWTTITDAVGPRPALARETAEALTRALLDKMLGDHDLCIRAMSEGVGDRTTLHALNVTVISLLMARSFGFDATELGDLGTGAMLHDIGKLDLPVRVREHDPGFSAAEHSLYRTHVTHGVAQAQRMGLSTGATTVIAQHHEMADGSGFPGRLNSERTSAAARIVALVNRYDNLCNPLLPQQALTPHEALSLLFAQNRNRFDATMLNAFIRMMGVYPPGSVVQLTDDRYALVVSVNSSRPLKPRVLVHDPAIAAEDALLVDLETQPDLGIRRSVRASAIPPDAQAWLSPRQRVVYFFEPYEVAEPALEQAA